VFGIHHDTFNPARADAATGGIAERGSTAFVPRKAAMMVSTMSVHRYGLVAALAFVCACDRNVERPAKPARAVAMQPAAVRPMRPLTVESEPPMKVEERPDDAAGRPVQDRGAPSVRLERVGRLEVVGDDPFLSLAVQDEMAYLVQGNIETGKRLRVVDISQPFQPRIVGSCDLKIYAAAVAVSGRYVYVLDEPRLKIIDVSDPDRPHEAGSCELGEHLWDLAIQGTQAYVTDLVSVRVVDLSEPAAPKEIGRCELEEAQGIALAGRHAFVACDNEGMSIVDIADPLVPRPVGRFAESAGAADVAIAGKYAYVAGGEDAVTLWVVDISDPKRPQAIGKYGDWIAGSVAMLDDYALIAGGELDIVDVSIPTAPKQAGSYRDASFVAVRGGDIFILGDAGFSILRAGRGENGRDERIAK